MKLKKKVPQSFHKYWLALIKEKTGASFVAWEQIADDHFLKIIINGSVIYCEVGGTPSDVTNGDYAGLLKDLLDGTRSESARPSTEGGEKE